MQHAVHLLLAFALLFASCANSSAQQVGDPAYDLLLKGLLDATTPTTDVRGLDTMSNPVLLDARALKEYEVSHIAGARWVGYDDFDMNRVKDLPKGTPIVVYCSVGYRSGKVTDQLVNAGYTNVRNLYGGIFEWMNSGHAVVDATGVTERVHAYDRKWGTWLRKGKKVY